MWKYVSRRIRDSVERTSNLLEHRRWTCGDKCGANNNNNQNKTCGEDTNDSPLVPVQSEKPVLVLVPFYRGHEWHNGSSSSKDDFRRQNSEFETKENILGALKWSGAIVCGWYASQILACRRRHLRHEAWASGRCRYSKALVSPSRAFHNSVLSHWVQNTPSEPQRVSPPRWLKRSLDIVDGPKKQRVEVFPVNNDLLFLNEALPTENVSEQKKQSIGDVQPNPTVENAVQDLLKVIGDIEFQLGVQHLHNDHFDIAVAHFKLGTSHHHSGSTFNLGLCYELGLGVEPNAKMALQCYSIAAEMGHPKALYNLGIYHVQGLAGLAKSRKMGRQFFKKAARLGQEDALRALGWRLGQQQSGTIADGLEAQEPLKQDHKPTQHILQVVAVA